MIRRWLELLLLRTGCCYRCNRPWITKAYKYLGFKDGSHHYQVLNRDVWWGLLGVRGHITIVTDNQGIFPLCETCWRELGTAAARRPYYHRHWWLWHADRAGDSDALDWIQIEQALIREEAA